MVRFTRLVVAGLALIAVACGSDPGPGAEPEAAATIGPAVTVEPAETVEPVNTSVPMATSEPTTTAERRPTAVSDPDSYTMLVGDDVRIKLPFLEAHEQYSAAMWIEHIPTSQYVFLDRFGRPTLAEIFEPNAKAALCAVLYNERLIDEAISRFADIRGPNEFERAPLDLHPCEPRPQPPAWTSGAVAGRVLDARERRG